MYQYLQVHLLSLLYYKLEAVEVVVLALAVRLLVEVEGLDLLYLDLLQLQVAQYLSLLVLVVLSRPGVMRSTTAVMRKVTSAPA